MMTYSSIPERAKQNLVEAYDGILPSGPWHGKRARLLRFRVSAGYADEGTEYIALHVDEAGQHFRFRYSGKNLKHAQTQVDLFKREIAFRQV